MELTKSYLKDLTYQINRAAIEVHKEIGAGLLESVYHKCMMRELEFRGIEFESEFKVPTGILYNFNCMNLYNEGQKTFVNHHFSNLEE
jgi:hypothetical protein